MANFGNSAANQQQSPGGLFGNHNYSAPTTTPFGSNNQSYSSRPGFSFGIANPQPIPTRSDGLFGQNTNNTSSNSGIFGQSQIPSATSGSLFGSARNNDTNSDNGGGIFGRPTNSQNTSGGLFGQTQNSHGSLFGQPTTTQGVGGSLNGNGAPVQASQCGSFARPAATNNFGGFGQSTVNHNNPAANSLFNNANSGFSSGTSLFGRPSTNNGRLFGNADAYTAPARLDQAVRTQFGAQQRASNIFANKMNEFGEGSLPKLSAVNRTVEVVKSLGGSSRNTVAYDYQQGNGTTGLFQPYLEKDGCGSSQMLNSISGDPAYAKFSHEELRLVDYNQKRHLPPVEPTPHTSTDSTAAAIELACKQAEIELLKAKIAQLELTVFQSENQHFRETSNKEKEKEKELNNDSTASESTCMLDETEIPTNKSLAARLNSQSQRVQDIESQLAKVTALLERSGLSNISVYSTKTPNHKAADDGDAALGEPCATGASTPTAVIFTPGSSTNTSNSPDETDNGFITVLAPGSTNQDNAVVPERAHTSSSEPTSPPTKAELAFRTWSLKDNDSFTLKAQEIWWYLRNHYLPTNNGRGGQRSASDIARDLDMSMRRAFAACDELVAAGLVTTTVDEDTFTVLGGPVA